MAFAQFPEPRPAIDLLQRSLECGRLAHAYLLAGEDLAVLTAAAKNLAKTLNCEKAPRRGATGLALDCCDVCASCRKIDAENHPDVWWVRPESKLRVITIAQMRSLMQTVQLKPTYAPWKVCTIVAADRLNPQAANAFLKTLEEPPADSVLILLSTEPQRMLETILSRCLRLNFGGEASHSSDPAFLGWLTRFSALASTGQRTLLGRYQLLSVLLTRLNELKAAITESLTKASPLERFEDIEPKLREQWEDELAAAIEAEYRRQRADLLSGLAWWLRDVWLATMETARSLWTYPQVIKATEATAQRLTPLEAQHNLQLLERTQRLLATTVQEALVLEVGLLQVKF